MKGTATLPFLAAAILGSANPVPSQGNDPTPITSWTKAFILIANVTDPSRDLSPSVNNLMLTGVHVGAGMETAVLSADTGRVLYENGTDHEVGVGADTGAVYPYSVDLAPLPSEIPESTYVEYIGIDAGTTHPGVTISPPIVLWPRLLGPETGTFVVCNESRPAYGRPQYPVRFAKVQEVNGVMYQHIPDRCAAIALLPQCAALGALPPGAQYNHNFVRAVRCFNNVASINWKEH